ncbi:MAG: glycosyltransferase, partial [Lentisphaeria bacterium]|nr:glycosyltransferase [Lentisphaeria bacterium]
PGWNQFGKAKVQYLPDSEYKKKTFCRIVDEIKPDLLYVSSLFSVAHVLPALSISRKKNLPLLLAPRGELNDTALSKKRWKKRLYISFLVAGGFLKNVSFQATSEQEKANIAKHLKVRPDKIYLLPNVPAAPLQKAETGKTPGKIRICFVGRIVDNKNLLTAIAAVSSVGFDAVLDIYGSKEDPEYWSKCEDLIRQAPKNVRINYKGVLNSWAMNQAYHDYDCLISPTEFENYGQAIVEAMLHDVPVIISEGTTPWDDVRLSNAGFVCSLKNRQEFSDAVMTIGMMDQAAYAGLIQRLRDYCRSKFDIQKLKNLYLSALGAICQGSKKG